MRDTVRHDFPTSEQVKAAIKHEKYMTQYRRSVSETVVLFVVVAAAVVLIAMLWVPVLEIFGSSMTPTLEQGEIVAAVKKHKAHHGDLVAFYYGNKLLVKRCIGIPGDVVDIADGLGDLRVGKLGDVPQQQTQLGVRGGGAQRRVLHGQLLFQNGTGKDRVDKVLI